MSSERLPPKRGLRAVSWAGAFFVSSAQTVAASGADVQAYGAGNALAINHFHDSYMVQAFATVHARELPVSAFARLKTALTGPAVFRAPKPSIIVAWAAILRATRF